MTNAPVIDDTGRHAETEAWLDALGIPWYFDPAFAFDGIDFAASKANQARLHALDEEVVERYTADYERGDRFPPVLLRHPRGAALAVAIGGNHRLTAASRAGRQQHAAYVVDVGDDLVALRLAYLDNRRHGLAPSDGERVLQARHLIDAEHITQGEAAQVVGLSLPKLNRGLATIKADERADAIGLVGWSALPKTSRWRLSSIESDAVFEAAGRLAVVAEMSSEAVYSLVRQLLAVENETEAMLIIGETEEELEQRRRNRSGGSTISQRATPRARMLEALRVIAYLSPAGVAAGCFTDDHRQVLRETILRAAKVLAETEGKLR